METIKVKTTQDVADAYAKLGVSAKRIEGLDNKFVTMPDQFKITGITAREVKIGNDVRIVPEFEVTVGKVKSTIPIGQLFAAYCATDKASQITKEGSAYKGKWLVSNNKRVNTFAEGMSEAEFIIAVQGKEFKANPAKDYKVYSGFVSENGVNVLKFHNSEKEALDAIQSKSYRSVEML